MSLGGGLTLVDMNIKSDERLPEIIIQLLKTGMRGHPNKAGMKDGSGKE
jgi:hypothetical protein